MRVTLYLIGVLAASQAFAQHRAYERSARPDDLIERWGRENSTCRGQIDPKVYQPACDRREMTYRQVVAKEWCYGQDGEVTANYKWHRCDQHSLK